MEQLKTGDLVMFQGQAWTSYVVRILTFSKWSHCGMIWRDPPGEKPGVYLLHSDGTLKEFGVQLVPFQQYVDEYSGKVFVYPLQGIDPARFQDLARIYQETKDAGYALYPPDIIRVVNGGCFSRAHQTQYFVCSTYNAYVYNQIGLICSCNDWTIVRPRDLVGNSDRIQWQECSFTERITLK